jgi:hypothetical protein
MGKGTDLMGWSARVDPVVERYRRLVPVIGQEEAALAMSAVGRMILAVERARAAGSQSSVSIAEDAIVQAGKLLEAVGGQSGRNQP